ncbi:hypothetical protein ATCC90586_009246 [Pythium insidiosum]|nr:hypothetical protein ATCC90586_009246 [Pythium insidiosum]
MAKGKSSGIKKSGKAARANADKATTASAAAAATAPNKGKRGLKFNAADADSVKVMRKRLAAIGCKLHEVDADGNCLFRALGDQLYGDQQQHAEIRKRVVDYIESKRDDFEPFMEDEEKFENYCRRMREDGTWGGNQEIYAAARLFTVYIVIHQEDTRVVIECDTHKPSRVLHLAYHGSDHYDSVRSLRDPDTNAPPIEIALDVDGFRPQELAQFSAATRHGGHRSERLSESSAPVSNSAMVEFCSTVDTCDSTRASEPPTSARIKTKFHWFSSSRGSLSDGTERVSLDETLPIKRRPSDRLYAQLKSVGRRFSLTSSSDSDTTDCSSRASLASLTSVTDDGATRQIAHRQDTVPATPVSLRSPRIEFETRNLLHEVMRFDQCWQDDAQVEQHFARLEWRLVRVQADGNCLFRALSDQFYGTEAFHTEIRQRIADFLEREKSFFQPFVEHEQLHAFEPIAAYCARMRNDGEWGGNPELFAAAQLFGVPIIVHQGPTSRIRISDIESDISVTGSDPTSEKNALHLVFRADHYDSVHDDCSSATQLQEESHRTRWWVSDGTRRSVVAQELLECIVRRPKPRKRVLFLGEELRAETVEIPDVSLHLPRIQVL